MYDQLKNKFLNKSLLVVFSIYKNLPTFFSHATLNLQPNKIITI